MMTPRATIVVAVALLLALPGAETVAAGQAGAGTASAGQTQPADPQAPTQTQPASTAAQAALAEAVSPEALARIRAGLSRPAAKTITDSQLRFYALVIAKEPTVEQIIGTYDLRYGATRGGNPMSHSEFLAMVTPREMYGSGGIKSYELLQFSLVNWAAQAIVKKGVEALQKARSEREVQEIRARIDRELEMLRRRSGG